MICTDIWYQIFQIIFQQIWQIDRTLTNNISPGQSGLGSNDKEYILSDPSIRS